MQTDATQTSIIVFDIGGTWFRWGLYQHSSGLISSRREPSVNYLAYPSHSADALQGKLVEFILQRTREMVGDRHQDPGTVSVSMGAPVNAHDMTVLGSGPLWGPTARPFKLGEKLKESLPNLEWHIVNDVTALLAPYMDDSNTPRRTMLVTVSTGIGSRLYDHRARRIPYDDTHGVQGEIGHLVFPFQLDGKLLNRRCECGGWNHLNAFSSGRGIAQTLEELPSHTSAYGGLFQEAPEEWRDSSDEYRLRAFRSQLDRGNEAAVSLLDAFVTPLTRVLAAALAFDPEIDRIVITGGVAHGLGTHYREALERTFARDGLYQISDRDPQYLRRRLHWEDPDDFAGLRGAGVYATKVRNQTW